MKTLTSLLTSLVLAVWVVVIAILSVQNATLVSLKFYIFQSIKMPLGVVIGICAALGMILGAILPIIWRLSRFSFNNSQPDSDSEKYDADF